VNEFVIALAQAEPVRYDKQKNIDRAAQLIAEAAAHGASLILFPEMFVSGYMVWDRVSKLAEAPYGPSVSNLCALAKLNNILIACGIPETGPFGRPYNAVCVIDRDGSLLGSYHKTHLFNGEPNYFSAGEGLPTFDSSIGKIGVLICYDLEFPEPARLLALRGARLLLAPTANMVPYQDYQRVYVRARARENGIFVATTNTVGSDGTYSYFGESTAVDPTGSVLCEAGSEEQLAYAHVDLSLVDKTQKSSPYLAKRRPDLYGDLVLGQTFEVFPDGHGSES